MVKRWITEKQIDKFKLYLQHQEKSRATIEKYTRDVRKFHQFLAGGRAGRDQVLAYKQYLVEHYKPLSVNSMLAALNCFFGFQGLEELKVKPLKIQRRIFLSQEKELTKQDYNKLLRAARNKRDERLELIMQTICAAGIRVSELPFITVESLAEGCIQINCKNKTRFIWIPEPLCRRLRKYAKRNETGNGPVFTTCSGAPIDRGFIWRQMKKAARMAEVDERKVFPHNLRHLFARTFYQMNNDIVKLADILGHSSVETTRIYTMTSGKEHAGCLERLGLISGTT